jgi:hypothetical protein
LERWTYAGNADIGAALGVNAARLEEGLALAVGSLRLGLGLGLRLGLRFVAVLDGSDGSSIGGCGDSEGGESQGEENGGFEELHCFANERMTSE